MIKSFWQKNPYSLAFVFIALSFALAIYDAHNAMTIALNVVALMVCAASWLLPTQAWSLLMMTFALSSGAGLYNAHDWFHVVLNLFGVMLCLAASLIPLVRSKPRALDAATIRALPPVGEDVQQLLASGQKIAAIKLYRARHKVGLKEALAVIDRFLAR